MKLASAIKQYGPGTKYNMPIPEIKEWIRLTMTGRSYLSNARKRENKYGIKQ